MWDHTFQRQPCLYNCICLCKSSENCNLHQLKKLYSHFYGFGLFFQCEGRIKTQGFTFRLLFEMLLQFICIIFLCPLCLFYEVLQCLLQWCCCLHNHCILVLEHWTYVFLLQKLKTEFSKFVF